jgi:hypothetical protein
MRRILARSPRGGNDQHLLACRCPSAPTRPANATEGLFGCPRHNVWQLWLLPVSFFSIDFECDVDFGRHNNQPNSPGISSWRAFVCGGRDGFGSYQPTTLLGSSVVPSGLLRRACARTRTALPGLDAQCRALELCFNVALNRLPATHAAECSSSSLVLPTPPTLSNALVAERRRCVELQSQTPSPPPATQQQQQTLLTIKVELDQLIVSILDDPSVSRVMREASAAVRACLEEETSLGHHGSASSHCSS